MTPQPKKQTPQELIEYYSRRLQSLDPKEDPSQSLLAEVFENLIEQNRKLIDRNPPAGY